MLPEPFLEILSQTIDGQWLDSVIDSFYSPKDISFFTNPFLEAQDRTLAELASLHLSPTPLCFTTNAFSVPWQAREMLTASAAFNQGKIYICTPSSLLPPLLLAPRPGETVLDLAAAPGGKTIRIAQHMENWGHISAVEPIKDRFFRLNANLKKYSVKIARTYLKDGRTVGRLCQGRFDKTLLDAPCSSEARFKAFEPKSWQHWSMRKVKEMARKQAGLLESAVKSTKPDGEILYCTCSFSPEENELIVNRTLHIFGEKLEVMPIELPKNLPNCQKGIIKWQAKELDPRLESAVRILPNKLMDGLFICRLKKIAS